MRLVDLIGPESILPALRAARKADVIREIAGHMAGVLGGPGEAAIADALIAREALGTTAIGEGVAVPHAKLGSLNTIAACLARSRRGVEFGAADGLPVHFFFVVLSPQVSAGEHLKLLARFSQIFKDPEFRGRLLLEETAERIYHLVAERDGR